MGWCTAGLVRTTTHNKTTPNLGIEGLTLLVCSLLGLVSFQILFSMYIAPDA